MWFRFPDIPTLVTNRWFLAYVAVSFFIGAAVSYYFDSADSKIMDIISAALRLAGGSLVFYSLCQIWEIGAAALLLLLLIAIRPSKAPPNELPMPNTPTGIPFSESYCDGFPGFNTWFYASSTCCSKRSAGSISTAILFRTMAQNDTYSCRGSVNKEEWTEQSSNPLEYLSTWVPVMVSIVPPKGYTSDAACATYTATRETWDC